MRKFIFLSLLTGLFIAGCSQHDLAPIKGPDGHDWLAISCKNSASACWRAAGDLCPTGYETADEMQSTSHGFLFFGHHMRDEMLIRCKSSEVAAESQLRAAPKSE
jgi:hypothetical protein